MAKTDWLKSVPLSATNRQAETPLYKFLVRLGMARTMSENSVKISAGHRNLTDISGTGSSCAKTFNVSTAAAIVAAGAGLPIAKQVNRPILSESGSSSTAEKLGINLKVEPTTIQACLNGAGIGFLYAPEFHPKLKHIGNARRHLGIRTCLNLLGVLTNPAGVSHQVVGVWHPSLLKPIAVALALLNRKAWVVHGLDGLDELTTDGESTVIEVAAGGMKTFTVSPTEFGLPHGKLDHIKAASSSASAAIIKEVLTSKCRDEARSLVVLNAAAALIGGGMTRDPMQAARLAEQSIDSGSALIKLERLQQTTNK